MVGFVLPVSLAAFAVMIWADEGTSGGFGNALGNNALPLFVFSALPAALISVLHTKALRSLRAVPRVELWATSTYTGSVFGGLLAIVLSLVMFADLSPRMWPLWLWGMAMGAFYGLARASAFSSSVRE
jgi:hypothetical protein